MTTDNATVTIPTRVEDAFLFFDEDGADDDMRQPITSDVWFHADESNRTGTWSSLRPSGDRAS